jgi:Tol biopolymer transport system component
MHPLTPIAVLFAAFGTVPPMHLAAQDIPVIEPPLSRLYGADDLDFGGIFVSGAVSPDGRWLVYSRIEADSAAGFSTDEIRMNLWIVPLDGSEPAQRLTSGMYGDADPLWFPSGRQIAFRTTRFDPEGNFQYLATLDVDASTGRAASVVRQLSLEPVPFTLAYRISPDGRQVAYVARPMEHDDAIFPLKVLPARGGLARTVWQQPEFLKDPAWPGDGYLYFLSYLAPPDDDAARPGTAIRRVPVGGGEPETLSVWPDVIRGQLSPDARYFLYRTTPMSSETAAYEIGSVHGQRLAAFTVPNNMKLEHCFLGGSMECLATAEDLAAPLKVIPIRGGPVRQITETRGYDWPAGWTPDGREVLYQAELDGTKVLMAEPLGGGIARQVFRLPGDEEWIYGPSLIADRYALYGKATDADGGVVLNLLDLKTGEEQEITRTPWTSYTLYHASRDGQRFLYADQRDGRFEYRSVAPGEEPVLLRSFPDSVFPPIVGVRGDRIAYWVKGNGESTLYLARAGDTRAKAVLTFPGDVGQRGSNPPTWSPDGRRLAIGYWRPETNELDALVVEVDESDGLVGEPRVIDDIPGSWWNLSWLPDGSGFLIVTGDVWLVPLEPGEPPVNLTAADPGPAWTYALSPDGRYVAVSPEVRRGGSIWKLDLGEVVRDAPGNLR